MSRSAAVICTRNRHDSLSRTVASIQNQASDFSLLLLVVDASDPEVVQKNKRLLSETSSLQSVHLSYPESPSLARQRNYGIERLPPDVEIVFFLDDDVTLKPGYFRKIVNLLDQDPRIEGVGGYDVNSHTSPLSRSPQQLIRYLFLLDHPQPGRILPSGEASPPHRTQANQPIPVQWLAGFSMAVRRSALKRERFDDRLEGYSHYEDRDLTLRIGRHGRLVTHPDARLAHRRAAQNRHDPERFNYSMLTHLYWFVEKNIQHPLRKPAFWWSTLGRLIATLLSNAPQRWDALRGLQKGVRAVMTRSHPLLKK